MSDCSTDAETVVKGFSHVGGLVGYNFGSIIVNCENNADITGNSNYVGGIVGGGFNGLRF
jgi:hypothetical protein